MKTVTILAFVTAGVVASMDSGHVPASRERLLRQSETIVIPGDTAAGTSISIGDSTNDVSSTTTVVTGTVICKNGVCTDANGKPVSGPGMSATSGALSNAMGAFGIVVTFLLALGS